MPQKNSNKGTIPAFLTDQRAILHLLSATLIFGILFFSCLPISTGSPDSSPHGANSLLPWVLFFLGLFLLCITKGLLYLISRHHKIPVLCLYLWLLAEFGIIIAALSFVAASFLPQSAYTNAFLAGTISKILLVLSPVPYVISYLWYIYDQKQLEVNHLRDILSFQQNTSSESPDLTINFLDKGGKLAFATKRSNVIYIEAADNYSNIHYLSGNREESFILHNSLKNVDDSFSSLLLLRCHRGYLVNLENVKLLRREKDGLLLEMAHCDKLIPVSKTYTESIIKHFSI